jgi:hypothetical protein
MILQNNMYVEKLCKFVRMKKKLTLLVDGELIDRMKEHAAARELSMSLLVEQFFAQQLSHKERLEGSIELSGEDRFIFKFGGIASDFGSMSDAEIKELVFLERLKKHS